MSSPEPEQQERRRRSLSHEDVAAILAAFESTHCLPSAEHKTHHEFVKTLIERERAKAERWEKIKTHVGGWAIVSAIGAVGTGAWHGAMWLKDHIK